MSDGPGVSEGGVSRGGVSGERRTASRQVLALAVPALGALVAEPLFLLVDSAIVGRLGTTSLAGLGVAGAILTTAVSVFVFLAYGTTASVARRLGADDLRGALTQGMDGVWLAIALGTAAAALCYAIAPQLVGAFDPSPDVADQAITYLRASLPGLPAMLVVLAGTGVLRGLQDTRTPLWVAAAGAVLNAVLNVLLVHGITWQQASRPSPDRLVLDWDGLGIAGSGLGTAITQVAMALAVTVVVVRGARRHGASLRPDRAGIIASARSGAALLVRTLTLRAGLLATTWVVAGKGDAALAAHQVVLGIWTLLALALDALAIAAQALTGRALGAGDVAGTRATTALMVRWGVWAGVVLGAVLVAVHDLAGPLFVDDPQVWTALGAALVVAGLTQPLAGYVFVLDGVLIGAGDGRYLAVAGVIQLLGYLPVAAAVAAWTPSGTVGLVWAWLAWSLGYMAARAVFLGRRARGQEWLVTGATR